MRTENTTALKVKYLGVTNTQGSRLSITQLNNGKRCILDYDYRYDTIGQIESIMALCPCVKNWNVIIDNTQNDFYLIGIEFHDLHGFDDVILEIKNIKG